MTTLQLAALREAIRKAFAGTYFNLCGIEQAHEVLLGTSLYRSKSPDLASLKALHCVDWKNLTMPERRELFAGCCRVLGIEPNVVGDFDQIASQSVVVSSNILPPITNA